jgi:DNA-binding transcriptional LysR family regulator
MLDIHHLRHFVAVADELHFGRAAKRIGLAQPALTKSIRRLEEIIGTDLFDRSHQRVRLTQAGRALHDEALRTVEQFQRADRIVQQIACGQTGEIRLAFVGQAHMDILPQAVLRFKRRWPTVELRLEERMTEQQAAGLRDGLLDLALINPLFTEVTDLETRPVVRLRLMAAVPSGSPLSARESLRLKELAGEKFVLMQGSQRPSLQGAIVSACRIAGFAPHIVQEVTRFSTILKLVAGGLGVSILPESLIEPGVTLVPISDLPVNLNADIELAWMKGPLTPALADLIDILVNRSASVPDSAAPERARRDRAPGVISATV